MSRIENPQRCSSWWIRCAECALAVGVLGCDGAAIQGETTSAEVQRGVEVAIGGDGSFFDAQTCLPATPTRIVEVTPPFDTEQGAPVQVCVERLLSEVSAFERSGKTGKSGARGGVKTVKSMVGVKAVSGLVDGSFVGGVLAESTASSGEARVDSCVARPFRLVFVPDRDLTISNGVFSVDSGAPVGREGCAYPCVDLGSPVETTRPADGGSSQTVLADGTILFARSVRFVRAGADSAVHTEGKDLVVVAETIEVDTTIETERIFEPASGARAGNVMLIGRSAVRVGPNGRVRTRGGVGRDAAPAGAYVCANGTPTPVAPPSRCVCRDTRSEFGCVSWACPDGPPPRAPDGRSQPECTREAPRVCTWSPPNPAPPPAFTRWIGPVASDELERDLVALAAAVPAGRRSTNVFQVPAGIVSGLSPTFRELHGALETLGRRVREPVRGGRDGTAGGRGGNLLVLSGTTANRPLDLLSPPARGGVGVKPDMRSFSPFARCHVATGTVPQRGRIKGGDQFGGRLGNPPLGSSQRTTFRLGTDPMVEVHVVATGGVTAAGNPSVDFNVGVAYGPRMGRNGAPGQAGRAAWNVIGAAEQFGAALARVVPRSWLNAYADASYRRLTFPDPSNADSLRVYDETKSRLRFLYGGVAASGGPDATVADGKLAQVSANLNYGGFPRFVVPNRTLNQLSGFVNRDLDDVDVLDRQWNDTLLRQAFADSNQQNLRDLVSALRRENELRRDEIEGAVGRAARCGGPARCAVSAASNESEAARLDLIAEFNAVGTLGRTVTAVEQRMFERWLSGARGECHWYDGFVSLFSAVGAAISAVTSILSGDITGAIGSAVGAIGGVVESVGEFRDYFGSDEPRGPDQPITVCGEDWDPQSEFGTDAALQNMIAQISYHSDLLRARTARLAAALDNLRVASLRLVNLAVQRQRTDARIRDLEQQIRDWGRSPAAQDLVERRSELCQVGKATLDRTLADLFRMASAVEYFTLNSSSSVSPRNFRFDYNFFDRSGADGSRGMTGLRSFRAALESEAGPFLAPGEDVRRSSLRSVDATISRRHIVPGRDAETPAYCAITATIPPMNVMGGTPVYNARVVESFVSMDREIAPPNIRLVRVGPDAMTFHMPDGDATYPLGAVPATAREITVTNGGHASRTDSEPAWAGLSPDGVWEIRTDDLSVCEGPLRPRLNFTFQHGLGAAR